MTRSWICSGGHPLYLIDGVKYCPTCELIAERGAKPKRCKRNHIAIAGISNCATCGMYRKAAWLQELDEHGKASCPQGHEMTHAKLRYAVRQGKHAERKCSACSSTNSKKANTVMVKVRADQRAAKGLPPLPPVAHRRGVRLKPDYIDWVVAFRLIEGKVDEVYDMKRGAHVGPTAMEKWVAYHSTPGDYAYMRTYEAHPGTVRHEWPKYGLRHGWKPKTLVQAIAET